MANQTNIQYIQTQDPALNQVQQNVNRVFNNIYGKLAPLQTQLSTFQGLGDIQLSALNLTQFQSVHGKTWIEANGQSSVGTAYQAFTMNNTVPTISVSGANAYIKVNN
jgi:hypothetical protein